MRITIIKSNEIETSLSLSTKESASFVCHFLPLIDFSVKPRPLEYTYRTEPHISYTYTLSSHKSLSLSGKVSEVLPVINFIHSYYQTCFEYVL